MKRTEPGHAASARAHAYLIINADDFAYFRGVSLGILDCIDAGTVTATGVFANSPLLDEHARWLARTTADVGVHLNLTDRAPLSARMSRALGRSGGRFPGKFAIARAVLAGRIGIELVREEWRAQIERCLAAGLTLRFLNSHEHIHMLPSLYRLALELAAEYRITHVRHAAPEWPRQWSASAVLRDGIMAVLSQVDRRPGHAPAPCFLGMAESGRLTGEYLRQTLPRLKPGGIYELMCHPGRLDRTEVGDARLLGYHDWEAERRTLTDPTLLEVLVDNGVRLVAYRQLDTGKDGLTVIDKELLMETRG